MEEIIKKLALTLQEIESYHGIVHNASSYDHVKQLHQQTRDHVAELRKSLQELFQQATPIIAAVAGSEMPYNDNNDYFECPYCPVMRLPRTETLQPQEHDTDCPIRLAAAWLDKWQHKEPQP